MDIAVHPEIAKRCAFDEHVLPDLRSHEDAIRRAYASCVRRGLPLEVNTSTARLPLGGRSLGLSILRGYSEAGGTAVTLGSDAHHPEPAATGPATAREAAQGAGLASLARIGRFRLIRPWSAAAEARA